MLYWTECQVGKRQEENKFNVAKMRMLRWMMNTQAKIGLGINTSKRSCVTIYCGKDGKISPLVVWACMEKNYRSPNEKIR